MADIEGPGTPSFGDITLPDDRSGAEGIKKSNEEIINSDKQRVESAKKLHQEEERLTRQYRALSSSVTELSPALGKFAGGVIGVYDAFQNTSNVFGKLNVGLQAAILAFKTFTAAQEMYNEAFRKSFAVIGAGGGLGRGAKALGKTIDDLQLAAVKGREWRLSEEESFQFMRQLMESRQMGIEGLTGGGFGKILGNMMENLVGGTGASREVFQTAIAEELRLGISRWEEGFELMDPAAKTAASQKVVMSLTARDGLFGALNLYAKKTGQSFEALMKMTMEAANAFRPLGRNTEEVADRLLRWSKLAYQGIITQQQALQLAGGYAQKASTSDLLGSVVMSGAFDKDLQRGGNLLGIAGRVRAGLSGDITAKGDVGGSQRKFLSGLISRGFEVGEDKFGAAEFLSQQGGPFKGMDPASIMRIIEAGKKGGSEAGMKALKEQLAKDAKLAEDTKEFASKQLSYSESFDKWQKEMMTKLNATIFSSYVSEQTAEKAMEKAQVDRYTKAAIAEFGGTRLGGGDAAYANRQRINAGYESLMWYMGGSKYLYKKLADEKGEKNVSEFISGAGNPVLARIADALHSIGVSMDSGRRVGQALGHQTSGPSFPQKK